MEQSSWPSGKAESTPDDDALKGLLDDFASTIAGELGAACRNSGEENAGMEEMRVRVACRLTRAAREVGAARRVDGG